jgi:ABC-type lipoprotein export system ATPase subunit
MSEKNYIIECDNLVKIYKTKDLEVLALQGLELNIEKGELMAIIGNSGSGKSTFLNMIGGLDRPSAGRLIVDGKDLFKLNEKQLVEYKRKTVGFVWQNNARNLIPYLSAWQNIQMPMLFDSSDIPYDEDVKIQLSNNKRTRALQLLELVGMSHRKTTS